MADPSLRFAIGNTVWTRALFDGSVRVDGFSVDFATDLKLQDRLYGVRKGTFAGGDPTFTDCILDRANGTSGELAVVLPVYLVSGFRHRTLLTRRTGPHPRDLRGHTVCVPRVLTPGGVWIRGLLQDEFGIARSEVKWMTAHTSDGDVEWPLLDRRLDYPEGVEGIRAATQLLSDGEIDALVHPGVHEAYSIFGGDEMVESTLQRYPNLWSPLGDPNEIVDYFKRTGIYPLVHALAIQERVARDHPGLPEALVAAFTRARDRARNYMPPEQRDLQDREREVLGTDPTAYVLGPSQRHALETLIRYLDEDGLLKRKPSLAEILPYHAGQA